MDDPVEANRLARRVAAFGLRDRGTGPFEVPAESWPLFLATVSGQRLTGLAVAAAEVGTLRLTDTQADLLLVRHLDEMMAVLGIERKLVSVADAFDRAGVGEVVLKGPALAHTLYPDPSRRSFGDLDLLVRTEDWRKACAVLAGLGLRRRMPEPHAGFDERFGKATVYVGDDGIEVDLHRTLVLGPFGLWIEPSELFRQTTWFELGGRRLRRLDDSALLLHACMHASLGWTPPLMVPLRDVAQVAHLGEVDWSRMDDWGRRWRLRSVIRHAFQTASATLGVELPAEATALAAGEPSRGERKLLERYTTAHRRWGATEISTMRAIPGLRAKAAYVRALLVPDREFLAARSENGAGRMSYLRRWMIPVRRLVGRRRS